jgi:transposase InsO family protein
MERPNQLWQMDFKGYFALTEGRYCHTLTVLDDHSRFLLGLRACADETYGTVQAELTAIFGCYGLPQRMLMDNGSPWGDDAETRHTKLTAWLIRLGIAISHGRPYHPQTQGKDERLHRTLKDELLSRQAFARLDDCQEGFDQWRQLYNRQRPHEALDMGCPGERYVPSKCPFPQTLPPVLYGEDDTVRKVDASGRIYFTNRALRIGKAFRHQPVAIRPTDSDQVFDVFFCKQKIAVISLANEPPHVQKV